MDENYQKLVAQFRTAKAKNDSKKAIPLINKLKNNYPSDLLVIYEWLDIACKAKEGSDALKYALFELRRSDQEDYLRCAHLSSFCVVASTAIGDFRAASYFNDRSLMYLVEYAKRAKTPNTIPLHTEANKPFSNGTALDHGLTLLSEFCSMDIKAFPIYGTLLGLERSGDVMETDRDFDIGVLDEDYEAALKYLKANNYVFMEYPNFHTQQAVLEPKERLLSFEIHRMFNYDENNLLGGFWNFDHSKEWQLKILVAKPELAFKEVNDYQIYYPSNADQVLQSIYRETWRSKDPNWVTLLHYKSFKSPMLKFYVKQLLVKQWLHGYIKKANLIATEYIKEFPDDYVIHEACSSLKYLQEKSDIPLP